MSQLPVLPLWALLDSLRAICLNLQMCLNAAADERRLIKLPKLCHSFLSLCGTFSVSDVCLAEERGRKREEPEHPRLIKR